MNTFYNSWVPAWAKSTKEFLGYPMVSDFMTYFPIYVYSSTIRNCREHILKKFGTANFEEVFVKVATTLTSPVNIIMSYAYHFERDLYEWHVDIGTGNLQDYNSQYLPKQHPLLESDILPQLHDSVHIAYYHSKVDPIEQAICYTQIHLGMKNVTHCKPFYNQANMQLFEFCTHPAQNHFHLCKGDMCKNMIIKRYEIIKLLHTSNELILQTNGISTVEDFGKLNYQVKCSVIKYVPFR